MPKHSVEGKTFSEAVDRLGQIGAAVRSKDTTLEESLDLRDEAIDLGLGAVELVDSPQFADGGDEKAAGGEDNQNGALPAVATNASQQRP